MPQLNVTAAIVALVSFAPVAAYPFMKRITWWPQAWLGLVFSWGALVGWARGHRIARLARRFCRFGSIAWVVGYDTLYAIQDIEDDALVGVKSSARRLGDKAPLGIAIFYGDRGPVLGRRTYVRPDWLALLALAPAAIHLEPGASRRPEGRRRRASPVPVEPERGLLIFLAMLVVGLSTR